MRSLPLLAALLVGCAAAPTDDDGAESGQAASELPSCASERFRTIYESARPFARRGSVPESVFVTTENAVSPEVFVSGPEIYPAMADAVVAAKREVLLQTYGWDVGSDGSNRLLAAFGQLQERRLREGETGPPVVVRINLDTRALSNAHFARIGALAGALGALGLDAAHVRFEVGAFVHGSLGSLHPKTLVVDSRVAIVGGANVEKWHDDAVAWYDAAFRVEGAAAQALAHDFAFRWKDTKLWTCGADTREPSRCLGKPPKLEIPAAEPTRGACLPVLIASRDGDGMPFSNRNDNPQNRAWIGAMRAATTLVRIHTPNLNDDRAKKMILETVRRGVRVELILSKGFNDVLQSLPGQGGTNEENVRALGEALRSEPEACGRLDIRWYATDELRPVVGNGPFQNHTKYLSLDGAVAIVGSGNMDTQSWNQSHETNIVVDDAATTNA